MLPEHPAALPELNLREYLQIIRRRKVVFIQVFAVVLAIGIVAAMTGKPIYEATAKLLVTAGSSSVSIVDSNNPIATMLAAAQPDSVDTQLQVLQSGPFLDDAFRLARITPKPSAAPPSVHAQAVENTNVIEVTAEGGDPKQNITGIYYIPPVAGAGEWAKKYDPSVAKNPLIFPSNSYTAKCDTAPTLQGKEEQRVTRAFDAVING